MSNTRNNARRGMDRAIEDMRNRGMECGNEMAKIAKIIHHNAIAIIPLYRSCIVITQSDEEKEQGNCTLHAYADPHWLGKDINLETMRQSDFHTKYLITGNRSGPHISRSQ